MQTYFVRCKRNTGNVNTKVITMRNGRLQMKSNCSVCGKRKSVASIFWNIVQFGY